MRCDKIIPKRWDIDDLIFEYRTVTWLMALPISDRELDDLRHNGSDKLEQLFEEQAIDYSLLN